MYVSIQMFSFREQPLFLIFSCANGEQDNNMPLDQTTQAKPGPAEVSSRILTPNQLRKRSSTAGMREDEHPQEAEHNQKRANTAQTDDQTTEIDDEMARMAQKLKEYMKNKANEKISIGD